MRLDDLRVRLCAVLENMDVRHSGFGLVLREGKDDVLEADDEDVDKGMLVSARE